jgi:hypothetical protein
MLSTDYPMPNAIYLLNTRLGNPYAALIFDGGGWAHERQDFHWEPFDDKRNTQLNALPYNWR